MWCAGILTVLAIVTTGAASASHVKIIYDTDMDTDVDDVGALAVLHALVDLGEADLLAVIHSSPVADGPVCVRAVNAWYGRESVPVGWTNWPGWDSNPRYAHYRRAKALIKERGSDYVPVIAAEYRRSKGGGKPPVQDGVSLYRKTLAAAEDGSVVICAVGQLAAIAGLMESGPDEYSVLSGPALVARKTKALVTMAEIGFPEGKDGFNWRSDLPSAAKVVNNWPTRLAVMPLGASILTGGRLAAEGAAENPCRLAYSIYVKDAHKLRSSWDLCAALYAVRGTGPWFREKTGYRVRLDAETGLCKWQEDAPSPQTLIEQAAPDESIREVLDELLVQPPTR